MIKRILLFTALFVLSICSLTLAEKLKMNKNDSLDESEDLDVVFTKVILNNEDITDTSIENDDKSVIFVLNNLSRIGDSSNLVYTISNHTDKDLNIKIPCTNTKQFSDYYTFNNTYENHIPKNQVIDGIISITLNELAEKKIKEMFMCKLSYTV